MNGAKTTREETLWRAGLRKRMSVCFWGLSFGILLPLAVLTANGLLGLIVHGIALSHAVSWFEKSTPRTSHHAPGDIP